MGLADPSGGPLVHQLVGKPCQLLDPAGDLFSGELARQRGGLGSVLVGVAEDTDGVQPCGGQELFELIDVVLASRQEIRR